MNLLIKCIAACLVMIGVDFVSKTPHFYLSGLMLSFPGLSLLAYYFMYQEQGVQKVRETLAFSALAAIPFAVFLLSTRLFLKKYGIIASLSCSSVLWCALALALALAWKQAAHLFF